MSVTSVQLPTPAVESAAISVRLPVPPSKAQVGPTPRAKVWMLVPAGTEPTSVLMSAPTMTDWSSASDRKSSRLLVLVLLASLMMAKALVRPSW